MSILSLVELHDLSEVSVCVFRPGIDLGVVLPSGTAVGYPAPAARRLKTLRPSGWSSAPHVPLKTRAVFRLSV